MKYGFCWVENASSTISILECVALKAQKLDLRNFEYVFFSLLQGFPYQF